MTSAPSSYLSQLRFGHALAIVRAIPQTSSMQPVAADKLQFYGLYKQATEGDVNIPRPSSRQVVEYAKWKAWSRMKGISPMDAQNLYVESLIHLLTELVHRYPHHEQSSFLKKALHSLEHEEEEEDDFFQDASDIAEFELQENFLNHIEADQLRRQDIYSPPSTPASAQTKAAYNHRHHSVSSHTEYPITPITSPGQNAMTGQWVSTQLQEQNAYAHPMDFLQHGDGVSQADTLDREVAAATANLILSSPRQSPYYTKKKHSHTSSVSKKSVSKKDSHRALERLQTEVTALTEQIDRMRRQQKDKTTFTKVVKVLLKHLMADSAIFLIAFYILWKRKSPLAYSLINTIMPFLQDIIRSIIRKVVFWKITV